MLAGIFLGLMTWASFLLMWWHSWRWVKVLSIHYFVLTDLIVTLFTWFSITAVTQSLTGVVAAMVAGLLTNFTMMLLGYPEVQRYVLGRNHGSAKQ